LRINRLFSFVLRKDLHIKQLGIIPDRRGSRTNGVLSYYNTTYTISAIVGYYDVCKIHLRFCQTDRIKAVIDSSAWCFHAREWRRVVSNYKITRSENNAFCLTEPLKIFYIVVHYYFVPGVTTDCQYVHEATRSNTLLKHYTRPKTLETRRLTAGNLREALATVDRDGLKCLPN